jgi:hypothetical protein
MLRCPPEFESRVVERRLEGLKQTRLLNQIHLFSFIHTNMVQNKAVVKSVLSGDTVILKGRPRANGPPAERLLALSNVQAPRLGNKDKDDEVKFRFGSHFTHLAVSIETN